MTLKGSKLGEFWKYRVGDDRISSSIEDDALPILVTAFFTLVFMMWPGRLAREAAVSPLRQIALSPFEKGG